MDGDNCDAYIGSPEYCEGYDTDTFESNVACCACGGGEQVEAYSSGSSSTPDIVNYFSQTFSTEEEWG